MSVITGLRAKDGYLFVTDNVAGDTCNNGDIVELGKYCGALIVTKKEELSKRVKGILNKYLTEKVKRTDVLTDSLINEIVSLVKMEFQRNPFYKAKPLPFLLLVVGIKQSQKRGFEHVFIRHRVAEVIENEGKREFITAFDVNPPIPATDIFFGDSNIIQYLSQQLPCRSFPLDVVKLLSYLSMCEFQQRDDPLPQYGFPTEGVKMASLSPETGFRWIDSEEIRLLADNARKLDALLTDRLNRFLFWEGL